uniref:B30.2/SPRY domain-containing protein n=1 Tax=Sphenodon punctatus TaxID=8508 RepID=A0A8D0G5D6_SPHPU
MALSPDLDGSSGGFPQRDALAEESRANAILDPDTASPWLIVSEDQKSARWASEWQDVPMTPERFDDSPSVLGCKGFASGRHFWEVDVKRGQGWAVGVARESVNRKGGIRYSPEEGIWAIWLWNGQYHALTSPETPLSPSKTPEKIRVCLDYAERRVAFSDADTKAPIFTFPPASFGGERILPIFWVMGTQITLCP